MVRDRAALLEGVRVLTNIWGGKADVMVPHPTTDAEHNQLLEALRQFDPDFIIFDPEGISSRLADLLSPLPCVKRRLRIGETTEFIDALNPLRLGSGQVPEPYSILQQQYPSGLQDSRIRVVDHDGPFGFYTRVTWGDASANVVGWLHNVFGAKLLRAPNDINELVRVSLVGNARVTPIDVSSTAMSSSLSHTLDGIADPLRGLLTQNDYTVYLFLDDGRSLFTTCAYWNSRAAASGNKLLLPFELFGEALPEILQAVRATRRVDNWIIVAELSEAQSDSILSQMREVVRDKELGGEIAVIRAGFQYSIPPIRGVSGNSTSMTVAVGSEDDIRFVSPKPANIKSDLLFGFDAEVTSRDGEKLSLPRTTDMALLLSNSSDRVRRFETNEAGLGPFWLHQGVPVRPRKDGIAMVTTVEQECIWYLPTPDRVVQQALRSRGVTLSINHHTRYAIGVAKRIGGLSAAMAFTHGNGFALLRPLISPAAAQAGLKSQRIEALLQSEYRFSRDAAKKLIMVQFPRLLETGLVRRGFALKCDQCDLTEWYPVSHLSEFVECAGCGERFQLSGLRLDFSYRINELARRMVDEGGLAVFETASVLWAIGSGQNMQLGGDLRRLSESEPFAECDLVSVNQEALAIAECKDYDDLVTPSLLAQVAVSLQKSLAVAKTLGAQIVVLGIKSLLWDPTLFALVSNMASQAADSGVAVHLVLNGQLHYSGEETPTDLRGMTFSQLLVRSEVSGDLQVTGSLPTTFGGGTRLPVVADDAIDGWELNSLVKAELPFAPGPTV